MNIIGDIAGQLDALKRLLEMMPKNEEIILVGDLVDRGPKSPGVVQFAIDNKFTVLMGNHEHMLIDYYEKTGLYEDGLWFYNGGDASLNAYESAVYDVMDHVKWMKTLKTYIETEDLLISHSCMSPFLNLKEATEEDLSMHISIIWNRMEPLRRDKKQIFGHNSHWGVKRFLDDKGEYAICIDSSASMKLTGYNTKEDKLYEVRYDGR